MSIRRCAWRIALSAIICLVVAADAWAAQVFWSEPGNFSIRGANLDGSGVGNVVSGLPGAPFGVAVDSTAGKLYWVTPTGGVQLQRANLDGSAIEALTAFNPGGEEPPRSLALDLTGVTTAGLPKLYAGQLQSDVVRRANLNGSGVEHLYDGFHLDDSDVHGIAIGPAAQVYVADVQGEGSDSHGLYIFNSDGALNSSLRDRWPLGVAVDPVAAKLYWIDTDELAYTAGPRIFSANLDGTNPQPFLTGLNAQAGSLAIDVGRRQLYWGDTAGLSRINLDGSGRIVLVPGTGAIAGVAILSVPEPAGLTLAAIGFLALTWCVRRVPRISPVAPR